ncbi:MAG: DUF4402 domain-containing protein [Sphingorhabdus sp.]
MKKGTYHLAQACAALCISLGATAGAHALPGDTQGQIVNPGLVTNASPLDFGRVIAGGVQSRLRVPSTSDTVIVAAGNAIPVGGTVSRARFNVVAAPLTLVLINLPSNIQLTRVAGTEQMLIDQFQQNGLPVVFMGPSGQHVFYVGGRLHVAQSQAAGLYQGTFNVTVNFL